MSIPVTDPIHYAPVTRPHRRWLAGSLALLLHLAVIGVVADRTFTPAPVERTSLDVVLVTHPSEPPEQAEAIAAADQRAAGMPEAEPAPAEARAAPRGARPERPVAEPELTPATEPQATPASPDSASSSDEAAAPPSASASGRDLLAQATASIREQGIAADFAGEQAGEGRPAAQRAAEARYIDDWTRRVEDYGNRVHPAPRELQGQLRIRVVIGRDGELRRAEVIQSSGHAELDQAALDTVRGAAPYRPFDRGMGELDSLSITRIWRFGQGNHYGVR